MLYIGLMSGTSLDAIDAVLIDIDQDKVTLVQSHTHNIEQTLKSDILEIIENGQQCSIEKIGHCHARLGEVFASAALEVLKQAGVSSQDVTAIGSHGQTIWHQPDSKYAFTMQIGDASRIAERTGITTVADFRSRDIAAGGQGAPLVPAFHRAVFSDNENRCIINIGGMANISYIPGKTNPVSGFDTGPGNVLMDYAALKYAGLYYDKNGDLARQGKVSVALLKSMLEESYFAAAPPKSTGRELFNNHWLDVQLNQPYVQQLSIADIMRTLLELTASSIHQAATQYYPETQRVIICGGGAYNTVLLQRLRKLFTDIPVETSSKYGIEPEWVEAIAFGWLAHCTLNKIPANEPGVTGASHRCILGAIYPA